MAPSSQQVSPAALNRAVQAIDPRLVPAVRALNEPMRQPVLALAGVMHILFGILEGHATDADELELHAPSACACGSGSIEMRAQVACNVVDFLYDEAKPGVPSGRIEMDAFVAAQHAFPMPRDWIKSAIHARAQVLSAVRLPTTTVHDEMTAAWTTPVADLVGIITMPRRFEHEPIRESMHALAIGLAQWQELKHAATRAQHNRLTLPLDELAQHSLRDRDALRWLLNDPGDLPSPTLDAPMLRIAANRMWHIASLLAHAHLLLEDLPTAQRRALLMYILPDVIALCEWANLDDDQLAAHWRRPTGPTRRQRWLAWQYVLRAQLDPRLSALIRQREESHA